MEERGSPAQDSPPTCSCSPCALPLRRTPLCHAARCPLSIAIRHPPHSPGVSDVRNHPHRPRPLDAHFRLQHPRPIRDRRSRPCLGQPVVVVNFPMGTHRRRQLVRPIGGRSSCQVAPTRKRWRAYGQCGTAWTCNCMRHQYSMAPQKRSGL